ncbi:thioesterase family protein [Niveomyces insectorum RCEF 264]|uniref:Thioesterase family protein n=1 Tax=Niveomyces insectorum RCEF 264 TaxID=1081102 RepID=A0A167UVK3_9HYPO|nr:thioesterase family protein [Niveomyces insectorum RCEF 264]
MAPLAALKARSRADYPFLLDYRTRWADNDMYAHMNNSVYHFLLDSVINTYLVQHCGLDPARRTPQYGMVVHAHTDFFASLAFPAVAELALRVARLGRSSVRYEVGVFEQGVAQVRAVGVFVQVFVDPATDRPNAATGMDARMRAGLERIRVRLPGDEEEEEAEKAEEEKNRDSQQRETRPAKARSKL